MDSKKKPKKWLLVDAWELGYDYKCPSCGYEILMQFKWMHKPEERPKCKERLEE